MATMYQVQIREQRMPSEESTWRPYGHPVATMAQARGAIDAACAANIGWEEIPATAPNRTPGRRGMPGSTGIGQMRVVEVQS